jgi:hypothetical protein
MIRLVWRTMRFTRGRTMALAAGLLVTAAAFSLLTATVQVNAGRINGTVGKNWRGEYDLLVLPTHSVQTGTQKTVVQVNYLSTATHGITMSQYQQIAGLPGVGVAAPLAIVGYMLESVNIPVTLSAAAVGQSGARVLVVTSHYNADQGLSKYPAFDEDYVYITPDQVIPSDTAQSLPLDQGKSYVGPIEQLPGGKEVVISRLSGWTSRSMSPRRPMSAWQSGPATHGLTACRRAR